MIFGPHKCKQCSKVYTDSVWAGKHVRGKHGVISNAYLFTDNFDEVEQSALSQEKSKF